MMHQKQNSLGRVNMGSLFEFFYAEVRCRICRNAFCCKDCRRKHEVVAHAIHPDCHVCLFGTIPISYTQASSELLRHLHEKHMPMHCIKCGMVFTTLDNITQHNCVCLSAAESAPTTSTTATTNSKTPMRGLEQHVDEEYKSPEVTGTISNQAPMVTSTPMTENQAVIKVPENITPVDADHLDTCSTGYAEKSTKRVTFFTTPAVENLRKKRKNPENLLKTSLKNSIRKNDSQAIVSRSTTDLSTSFTSANENLPKCVSKCENLSPTKTKKRLSQSLNETLWMSAINTSFDADSSRRSESSQAERSTQSVQNAGTSSTSSSQETSVWSSVTSIFKNVVRSFNSSQEQCEPLNIELKRSRSMTDFDNDVEDRKRKRHKLCDIKCRPPIRPHAKSLLPRVNKSIQTDF